MGRILTCTRYGFWTRKIKMIRQRKPGRNVLYKWCKLLQGCSSLSLSPLVYLSTCIHFPSNKHFTCFNKIVAQKECYWQAHINETEVLSTPGETLVWSQCHLAFSGIVGCGSANFWMWNLSKNSMSWPNTLEQWQEPWTMQWRPGLPNFVGC